MIVRAKEKDTATALTTENDPLLAIQERKFQADQEEKMYKREIDREYLNEKKRMRELEEQNF